MGSSVGAFFQRIRDNIEAGLGRWGHFSYRYAWLVILLCLLAMGALVSNIKNLDIVASTEDYLHEDDPTRLYYNEYRKQYGRDQKVLLLIESDNIWTLEFMQKLRDLHKDIENEVPYLVDVLSLYNARNTRGEGDRLIVGDLMEDFPQTQEELLKIKAIADANPLYKNNFYNPDNTYAAIVMETNVYSMLGHQTTFEDSLAGFDDTVFEEEVVDTGEGEHDLTHADALISTEEDTKIVDHLKRLSEKYQSPDFKIRIGGSPPMIIAIMKTIGDDLTRFTAMSMSAIGLLLLIMFRRVVMILLPLAIAFTSVMSTLSFMALVGLPMTMAGQIVPSFLVAVGVGNSVHIFSVFFQALNRGDSKKDALAHALSHSGLAVIMTGLTTAGGLLSFVSAGLKPVADFGLIAPIGILFALFLSLVFLPALIAVFPMKTGAMAHRNEGLMNKFLVACGNIACDHPVKVIVIWLTLFAAGLTSAINGIYFSHNPMSWFVDDDPIKQTVMLVNDKFDGGMSIEMLVDTGKVDGVKDPEVLRRIDEIVAFGKTLEVQDMFARQGSSLSDVSKEIHQALNENRSDFYAIPDDPKLLAQELLLFENSGTDDLEDLVDSQFTTARVTIKIPFTDALHFVPFNNIFEPKAREIMGDKAELHFTGIKAVMGKIFYELIYSMASSYMLAVMIITPLMVFLIGSLRFGLVSMIPNLTPIIITLGVMGYLGVPLDGFTLLIGSIALGLAVDDTIHFMHNFHRYYNQSGDGREAVMKTLTTTGHALLFTSVVLSFGFLVYTFSSMANLINFGFLTALCISLAFLADVLFAPALVVVLTRKRKPNSPV